MRKFLIIFTIGLAGCSDVLQKNEATREEFTKLSKPIEPRRSTYIPKKQPLLPSKFRAPLSIDIDDSIPLKDIYLDLCKQGKIGCEISNHFKDVRVHFSAHKKAFIEILEDLASLTHKRITIIKDRIRIGEDSPYLVNYNVQFLTGLRSTQNKISTATQVLSGTINDKNMLDNGSSSLISTQNDIDFWKELDSTIKTIMIYMPTQFYESDKDEADDEDDKLPEKKTMQNYALHKQAGLLSVVGTSMQHKAIANYIKELKKAATAQVLIEAKIIEVALNKKYESGINWDLIFSTVNPIHAHFNQGTFSVNYDPREITEVLRLMEQFGTTKTLSSPRLTVMNNQNAVLKVGENRVFFRVKYSQMVYDPRRRDEGSGSDFITANSEIQTVPIGITLSVQPSINLDTGEITLSIRPTITNSHENVQDPAVQIAARNLNIKSEIPVIEVRELDSILTIKSGRMAIIGGLMQEKVKDRTTGIPGTSSGTFLDSLFGTVESERKLTELVIFLKATILDSPDPDEKDMDVYQESIHDNRPWSAQ